MSHIFEKKQYSLRVNYGWPRLWLLCLSVLSLGLTLALGGCSGSHKDSSSDPASPSDKTGSLKLYLDLSVNSKAGVLLKDNGLTVAVTVKPQEGQVLSQGVQRQTFAVTSGTRYVLLQNLPVGKYLFEISVSNSSGQVQLTGQALGSVTGEDSAVPSAVATLTPPGVAVKELTIIAADSTSSGKEQVIGLAVGSTRQLQCVAFLSDGSSNDFTGNVAWVSEDPQMVAFDPQNPGLAKAIAPTKGVKVHAQAQAVVSNSLSLLVEDSSFESLTLSQNSLSMALGLKTQLVLNAVSNNGDKKDVTAIASWHSSDPSRVSVTAGLVKALQLTDDSNPVIVSAELGDKRVEATVEVTEAVVTEVKSAISSSELSQGDVCQLTARAIFSNGTSLDLSGLPTESGGLQITISPDDTLLPIKSNDCYLLDAIGYTQANAPAQILVSYGGVAAQPLTLSVAERAYFTLSNVKIPEDKAKLVVNAVLNNKQGNVQNLTLSEDSDEVLYSEDLRSLNQVRCVLPEEFAAYELENLSLVNTGLTVNPGIPNSYAFAWWTYHTPNADSPIPTNGRSFDVARNLFSGERESSDFQSPYLVGNPYQLSKLMVTVPYGDRTSSQAPCVKQTDDIDMNGSCGVYFSQDNNKNTKIDTISAFAPFYHYGYGWQALRGGYYSSFYCSYYGEGHSINGIMMRASEEHAGIFSKIARIYSTKNYSPLVIENLSIGGDSYIFYNSSGIRYIGSFAGEASENVVLKRLVNNSCCISCESSDMNEGIIGGVVGLASYQVLDCENHAFISKNCGEGSISPNDSICGIGGIVGFWNPPAKDYSYNAVFKIENCVNTAEVYAPYCHSIGGIVGRLYFGSYSEIESIHFKFIKCRNLGVLTGFGCIGGIVGYINEADTELDGCSFEHFEALEDDSCQVYSVKAVSEDNSAQPSFADYAGGLVGYVYQNADGNRIIIKYCYFYGKVVNYNMYNRGGFIGYSNVADSLNRKVFVSYSTGLAFGNADKGETIREDGKDINQVIGFYFGNIPEVMDSCVFLANTEIVPDIYDKKDNSTKVDLETLSNSNKVLWPDGVERYIFEQFSEVTPYIWTKCSNNNYSVINYN